MLLVAKNIISDSNLFFYLYNFSQSTTFEYNSLKINLIQKNKAKIYFLIIAWLLYFCSLSLLILKKWALNRFPIDNPETVYFVLGNPKELSGFDKSILFELIYIEVLIFLMLSL